MNESYKSPYRVVGYSAEANVPKLAHSPAPQRDSSDSHSPGGSPRLRRTPRLSVFGDDAAAAAASTPQLADDGNCHVLVLSLSVLTEKVGQHWILDRKRQLFTTDYKLLSVFLATVPFLETLSADQMDQMCRVGSVVRRPANYVIVSEGLPGDAFFVLLHGQVDISIKGVSTAHAGTGKHFGETSLIKDIPTTATVRSVSPCLVLCYHKTVFLELMGSFPGVYEGLETFIEHCTVVNLKSLNLPLFQKVSDDRMDTLARNAVFRVLAPGEILYSKGDVDDNGFIVSQVRLREFVFMMYATVAVV